MYETKGTACAKGKSSKRIQNIRKIPSTEVQEGEHITHTQEKRRDGQSGRLGIDLNGLSRSSSDSIQKLLGSHYSRATQSKLCLMRRMVAF